MTLDEQIVNHAKLLRDGDTVKPVVFHEGYGRSLPWVIEIRCDRQVWPCPATRGGFSNRWFIGRSRTEEGAASRAGQIIRKLRALRIGK